MAKSDSQKMNFLIDGEVSRELQALVPPGQRSKVVSLAIGKELQRLKRQAATEKLLSLRKKGPKVSTEEILSSLRTDRDQR